MIVAPGSDRRSKLPNGVRLTDGLVRSVANAGRSLAHAAVCTMFGVPEMLRSAIENVVRNAIRHTPVSTAVELPLKQRGAGKALLKVRDHGPGVPEKNLSSIFLPFHQVPETEPNSHGADLRLAIADRVAHMHEGTISP